MSPDEVLERTQWDLFWVPPDTVVVDRPELMAVAHDSDRRELNMVTRTREADLPALIEEVRALHGARPTRWLVVPQVPTGLPDALTRAGFGVDFEAWAYTAEVERWTPRHAPSAVEVRRVATMGDLHDCLAANQAAFSGKTARTEAELALELAQCTEPGARVRRYVAYLDGEPVASAGLTVFPKLSFGFLWAGGTAPHARGRGAYSALVAARVAAACSLRLARVGLYAKTDTSAPIVERQGFERGGPMAYFSSSSSSGLVRRPAEPLRVDGLVVRRQHLDDNASDYAAVMANRDWLRRWSGSDWPEDRFTPEENADDLGGHIADHDAGEALGYTIASPAGEVLGSLYVQPLDELLDDYSAPPEIRARLGGRTVRADVWTRLDLDPDLLTRAVAALDRWLGEVFPGLVWCARVDCPELEAAYAACGLHVAARLVRPDSGRVQLLFTA